jgi:hypothetical protein
VIEVPPLLDGALKETEAVVVPWMVAETAVGADGAVPEVMLDEVEVPSL